jgi:sodium/hydrogen antiporter
VAGNAINWDGRYLAETHRRHDVFNSVVERLLNFGAFMFIGLTMPWDAINASHTTGITLGRLFGLGSLVLLLRRIPAIMISYRFMPEVCQDWKEALFMGYFGPIGLAPASFYSISLPDISCIVANQLTNNRDRCNILCGVHP